ncbi:phage baseplate assembly protein V [Alcaligenes faecalis]|uniref:phage baseplate assembly protein V n=1 Tax=Alcaligenes faecalis TaxID=511 RepID=UPI00214FE7A0|nr:phage baseplate assembly protein V [Alcaligenes faecalis]MCR4146661.1 phage baseplate assembly protein V [Alcaligenes faecalis]
MKILNFIARGTLSLVDAARKLQGLQVRLTAGEVKDGVEHVEPYGFTSHPLPGAEAVLGFVGGNRSHCVAFIVTDRRYRPVGLQRGEVCLFTHEGDEIRLKQGRVISIAAGAKIEVTAPEAVFNCSTSVTLNTPKVIATGDIEAAGEIRDGVGTMSSMRGTFNGHDHPENDNGGPTDKPNQRME